MNPTFRHIDWTACAPGVTRSGNVKLRVWAKGAKAGNWQQLLSVDIALDGLYYLGKNVRLPGILSVNPRGKIHR